MAENGDVIGPTDPGQPQQYLPLLLDALPTPFLFAPRSAEDQVVLYAIGAIGSTRASRSSKRDALLFLRWTLEPNFLLHPTVLPNYRVFHALDECHKS